MMQLMQSIALLVCLISVVSIAADAQGAAGAGRGGAMVLTAPATGPMHHYTIEVYALDTRVDITPSTNATLATAAVETRTLVMKAMQGHVLGKAVYVGLFRRPP